MFLNENQNSTLAEDSGEFAGKITPDMFGAMDMVLESEREWHNLEMKMIKAEHAAIVNEDAALMENAVGDFFKKAKVWFEKMWKKIVEFVKRLLERVGVFFASAKKFLEKYEAPLRKLKDNQMKGEVEYYLNIEKTGVESVSKVIAVKDGDMSGQKSDDEIRAALGAKTADEVKKEVLGDKETKKITAALVGKCLDLLRAEGSIRNAIKAGQDGLKKLCDDGIKACDGGSSDAEKSANNVKIANYRKAVSIGNVQFTAAASCISTLCSDALKIAKKAWTSRPKKEFGPKSYDEDASILDQF